MPYFAVETSANINTAILIGVALVVGLFTLVRGRADVWKSNYEGEKERADNLQKELTTAKERIVQLEAQPNVEQLFRVMEHHDKNAAARNARVIKVLDRIAEKVK